MMIDRAEEMASQHELKIDWEENPINIETKTSRSGTVDYLA